MLNFKLNFLVLQQNKFSSPFFIFASPPLPKSSSTFSHSPSSQLLFQIRWLILNSWSYNKIMQKFEQIECIGTGAYSVVYKAVDKLTNQTVAIKQVSHKNT